MASQCHLVLPGLNDLKWWRGGPPGPQPTPSSACLVWRKLISLARSGSRGTRADQGVCPTTASGSPALGKLSDIGMPSCPTASFLRYHEAVEADDHSEPAIGPASGSTPGSAWASFKDDELLACRICDLGVRAYCRQRTGGSGGAVPGGAGRARPCVPSRLLSGRRMVLAGGRSCDSDPVLSGPSPSQNSGASPDAGSGGWHAGMVPAIAKA